MKHVVLSILAVLFPWINANAGVTDEDIEKAYIYGFPLVIMDVTKNVLTDTPTLTDKRAPINQFLSKKTFPDPTFTEIVSPNADTLYTQAWLDVSKEPIILSVPDMGDRYYLFPMLDEWTNVFFSPGTRTTGSKKADFAITGPNWKGDVPQGVKVIKAPTDIVWIIGRIQTNGPSDYAAVNKLQEQFKLTPLSAWGTEYVPPTNVAVSPNVDSKTAPIEQTLNMNGVEFFTRLAKLLKTTPIPAADKNFVGQFAKYGFVPGQDFDVSEFSPEQIERLNAAVKNAQTKIKSLWDQHTFAKEENGWGVMIKDIGDYGTNYDVRAAVAYGGLGANLPQDAIYPVTKVDSQGQPLNGKNFYTIHFDKGQLPPVGAFWSVTMYDDHQFFVQNPLNRYALGDRDQMKFDPDGSLTLYLQHQQPEQDKFANWLPAPEGDFNLLLRLYDPKPEALNGTWQPPTVKKIISNHTE